MENGKPQKIGRIEGVHVATVTFFDDYGEVDENDLTAHLHWLASHKVDGFVPCGTTGEASVLDRSERSRVLSITAKVGREYGLKLIAGCGSNSTRTVIELTQEASDLGYQAALVVSPYYNKPTPTGVLMHYEMIAQSSPIPIVLYNVPSRTNCPITCDVASELLKHPNIVGIKDASGNYQQWLGLARNVDLNSRALLAGDDDSFSIILGLGGSGMISGPANVYPQAFVDMYRFHLEGKHEIVRAIQLKILPLIRALFMETNPAPVKFALQQMHQRKPFLRLPLVPVTNPTEVEITRVLKTLELL